MAPIRYFAYGSNMLSTRLERRCRTASVQAIAWVEGFALTFSKRSRDGSGKATVGVSDLPDAYVHGVVFEIDAAELHTLDRSEGVGRGYNREDAFQVTGSADGRLLSVTTYIADPRWVDRGLTPYDWYLGLVLEGARQHGLPLSYIAALAAMPTISDPVLDRQSRLEALALLARTELQ